MRWGDTLLLYSDGVAESRNSAGEELEYPGLLKHFLHAAHAETCGGVIETMHQAVLRHEGGEEQHDDITLLAFRHWGPGGKKAGKGLP